MTDNITSAPATYKIDGTLKWFDRTKGFGFLTSSEFEEDIFLHHSVLADAAKFVLLVGSVLEVLVQDFKQGVRVIEVISIQPPVDVESMSEMESIASIEVIPARVKWFDKCKGFGFANAFQEEEDIFVHFSILERYGIRELNPNEAVSLRVQYSDRGAVAVDICDWVEPVAAMPR